MFINRLANMEDRLRTGTTVKGDENSERSDEVADQDGKQRT